MLMLQKKSRPFYFLDSLRLFEYNPRRIVTAMGANKLRKGQSDNLAHTLEPGNYPR